MTYTDLQTLMEDLKQLMCYNHTSISPQSSQFQLLGSMIQILFAHQPHDLEKLRNLQKQFKDAADLEAQGVGVIDLFESAVEIGRFFTRFDVCKISLDLEDVMRSIISIKLEFYMINCNKIDSSRRSSCLKTQSADASSAFRTRNSTAGEEIVVDLERDVEVTQDKLAEDQKQVNVVSIVGMGGSGNITLATKVFNDPFVVYHFHVRVWVTVSQTYEKRNLLIQIPSSIDVQQDLEKATHFILGETLHKGLIGRRYLIVIDDIWSNEAWDDLKLFFHDHDTRSRILLTSHLKEADLHAKSNGFVHHLQYLTQEESRELLRNKCPKLLIEPRMQIARSDCGLPLAEVVAQETLSKDSWVKELLKA